MNWSRFRKFMRQLSRLLTRRDFRSRDIHWEVVRRVLKKLAPTVKRGKRDWLLALDGTATKRGSETKIKGGIQTEKAATRKKRKAGSPRARSDGSRRRGERRSITRSFSPA